MPDRYAGSAQGEGGGFGGREYGELRASIPRPTPAVKFLLISNTVAFLAVWAVGFWGLDKYIEALRFLGLTPEMWFSAPVWLPIWQFVTSVFVHAGLRHLFGNLLMIYFFGTMLEGLVGTRRFVALYAGAALAGSLAHLLFQGLIDPRMFAVGASGAALGVMIAMAVLEPNARIILILFPIKLKWLAIGVLAIDVFGLLDGLRGVQDGVAHWVHLGGAAYGFVMARTRWIWIDPVDSWQKRKKAAAIEKRQSEDKRMDELLAKISAEGMNSLSRGEKEFLKRVSSRR